MDLAIVSEKWLNFNGENVFTYSPPPKSPTTELAKAHSTPISGWGKVDIVNTLFVDMDWYRIWKKYKKNETRLSKNRYQSRNHCHLVKMMAMNRYSYIIIE